LLNVTTIVAGGFEAALEVIGGVLSYEPKNHAVISSIACIGVPMDTAARMMGKTGVTDLTETYDFFFAQSDLAESGEPITPEPGDVIIFSAGKYLVNPIVPNAGCYEFIDPERTLLRVHGHFVETVEEGSASSA